jgi:beta-lactamase superfamily II metal-dependent hydrolase
MIRKILVPALLAATALAAPVRAAEPLLRVVALDMEGGGGTLYVTPEGKSLLIDTGSGPPRDGGPFGADGSRSGADRIISAAHALGLRKIDYLITTHYHTDHIGGLFDLMKAMPIGTFIDHGPNQDKPFPDEAPDSHSNQMVQDSAANYARYLAAIKGHPHIEARPGQVFHFGSLTATVVASAGKIIAAPLPGAGGKGQFCDTPPMTADGGYENGMSVASVLTYGKVRIAAFGDLVWNREHELACPIDKVGQVQILIVTHHGVALSTNPSSIAALRPDIAVMGNSAKKGAVPATVNTISHSPGLQAFWKVHASTVDPDLNGDPRYIANLDPSPDHGDAIWLDVTKTGHVTVTNSRNGFSQSYDVK